MMNNSQNTVLIFLLITMSGCGVDTFQCDDCDDPFELEICKDEHSQFHQGVIYELSSGKTEFIDLNSINPFNEGVVKEANLYALGDSRVLIATQFGNYVFDERSKQISVLGLSETQVIGNNGVQNLYLISEATDDIVINDSTAIKDFIASTTILKSHIIDSNLDTVAVYESRFIHPDSLLIPKLFFPVEIPSMEGFIALAEDEIHYVSVSSTTNRIRTVFEYKTRSWKHFNNDGESVATLTNPRKVISEIDPTDPSFSEDPIIISHQEGEQTIISRLQDASTYTMNIGFSPRISQDGNFISVVNNNSLEVLSLLSEEILKVFELGEVGSKNPSTFSESANTLIYAESDNISDALRNAVIKNSAYVDDGSINTATIFQLTDHVRIDSLDYLISSASQPVFMDQEIVFFLLFQHQLSSCD